MKALFFCALIVLALCVPEKHWAMWAVILIGVILGNLKYNLRRDEK
jgi:UDP-N-acetylmuramyl pentapeptide phosphotransferase/UDP-N-acetylglucosamine-1-phosphate transferase